MLQAAIASKPVAARFGRGKPDCVAWLQENLQVRAEAAGSLRLTLLGETAVVQAIVLNAIADSYVNELRMEKMLKEADLRGLDALLQNWQGECRRLSKLQQRVKMTAAYGSAAREAKEARLKVLKRQEKEARDQIAQLVEKKRELTAAKDNLRVFLLKRAP